MGGLAALALSGFLSEDDYENLALQNHVGADFITWTLRLSITELLSEVMTPRCLANYARRIGEALFLDLRISCEEADLSAPSSLGSFLVSRIGHSRFEVALILIDVNKAHGFEVLSTNKNSEASASKPKRVLAPWFLCVQYPNPYCMPKLNSRSGSF